jgi:hypothetical protein
VRLRNQVMKQFEEADLNPGLIEHGALNFVVVGAGQLESKPQAHCLICSTTCCQRTTTNWLQTRLA